MPEADVQSSANPANEGEVAPFESFESLRHAHLELKQAISDAEADSNRSQLGSDKARAFISRAQATGTVIADRTERRAAQGILDYWCAELVSAPGARSSDFSPARLSLPDQTKIAAAGDVAPTMDPKLQERSRDIIRLAASARQYRDSGKQRGYLLFGTALKEASKYRDEDPDIAALIGDSEADEQRYWRVLLSGLLGAIAILLVFLAMAIWQWQRAEEQRADAEQQRKIAEQKSAYAEQQAGIAHKFRDSAEQQAARIQDSLKSLVEEVEKQISEDPYSASASSLLKIALNLTRQAGEMSATPERVVARINLMLSVVDIYVAKADPGQALVIAQQAKQLSQQLVTDNPNSETAHYVLYRSEFRVGDALAAIDIDQALPDFETALRSAEKYAAFAPDAVERQSHVAFVQAKIGDLYYLRRNWSSALQRFEAALKIYEMLVEKQPRRPNWRRDVATTLLRIGDNLAGEDRFADAISKYQTALTILAGLPETDISYQSNLSNAHNRLATAYLHTNRFNEALKEYQAALEIRIQLTTARPNSPAFQNGLAQQHVYIADALLKLGADRTKEAIGRYQSALKIRELIVREAPGNDDMGQSLANTNDQLGDIFVAAKLYDEAGERYNAAAEIRERLAKKLPDNLPRQSRLVRTYIRIGDLLQARGDTPGAVARYKITLGIVDRVLSNPPTTSKPWEGRKEWERLRDQLLSNIRKLS